MPSQEGIAACLLSPASSSFDTLHSSTHIQDFTCLKAHSDPGTQGSGLQPVLVTPAPEPKPFLEQLHPAFFGQEVASDINFPSGLATGARMGEDSKNQRNWLMLERGGYRPSRPRREREQSSLCPCQHPRAGRPVTILQMHGFLMSHLSQKNYRHK